MGVRSGRRRKPSPEYSRVFAALTIGGYLLVTGIIGYDVTDGGRWAEAPIWRQLAPGAGLLLLAGLLIRRLPVRWIASTVPRRRMVHVGAGQSAGAQRPAETPRAIDAHHGDSAG